MSTPADRAYRNARRERQAQQVAERLLREKRRQERQERVDAGEEPHALDPVAAHYLRRLFGLVR